MSWWECPGLMMPLWVQNATFIDVFIQALCSAFVTTVTETDFLGHKNDSKA